MKNKKKIFIAIAVLIIIGLGVLTTILLTGKHKDSGKNSDNVTDNVAESITDDAADTREIKAKEWADAVVATDRIEKKYDFTGDDESKLANFEQMSVELEALFDGMVNDGTISSYDIGLLSYYLNFPDGLVYMYSAPFTIDNLLAGNSGASAHTDTSHIAINAKTTEKNGDKGKVLVVETCSDQKICPNILLTCADYIIDSGLNYQTDYYGESQCNNMETLYKMLTSWANYDVIIWESHGENVQNRPISTKICIANNIPFSEYETFIKKHPEFDITEKEGVVLPGIVIGKASFGDIDGTESSWQKEIINEEGQVLKTISLVIDADTIDALYKDNSFKDTIIYLGCCFGGQNDILPNTFIKKGARAIMVYANGLSSEYHDPMARCIWSKLPTINTSSGELYTVEEAVKYAKEQCGEKDPTHTKLIDILKRQYEKEYERSYMKIYAGEKDVKLIDYSKLSGEENSSETKEDEKNSENAEPDTGKNDVNNTTDPLDKYADSFTSGIKENHGFLTEEQLSAENDIYQDLLQRLKDEESTEMADALNAAMRLFYIVSCDNGYMKSYKEYQSQQKYTKVGEGYYTDIINGFAKNSKIGYYNLIYIGAQYSNPKDAMNDFMTAIDARKTVPDEFTATEKEAIELCNMYLTTFINHKENIKKVADALISYCNNYSAKDNNSQLIERNKSSYETGVQEYYDTLEKFEKYIK